MPSWKKLIVSGSDASLSSLTATSYGGNISGSATSTGSFAQGFIADKLGIGTTSPVYSLHVEAGNDLAAKFSNSGDRSRVLINDNDTDGFLVVQNSKMSVGLNNSVHANNLTLLDGKVGIGTTSPSTMLHLKSSTSTTPKLTIEDTNADDNMGALQFIKDSASPGTGDKLMQIWAYGDNNAAEQILYSEIATLPTSVADGSEEGSMRFRVMSGGSFVETMRVRGGNVGIGTTSPGVALEVIGSISGSATSTGSFGAVQSAGNITPKTDDSVDLGASNLRFKNIFTTDLQLSNEGKEKGNEVDGTTGSWTIQEGEEELYLLNRKNGKKYKFMLQEIK